MKRKFLLFCMALLGIISVSAQTLPNNNQWYYIKLLPRSTDLNAKWLKAPDAGGVLTNVNFVADDALLWKVVTNGNGIALMNKKYGTYLDADKRFSTASTDANTNVSLSTVSCVASMPVTTLMLLPYPNQTTVPGGFYLLNSEATNVEDAKANTSITFQLYSAGAGSNYRPINYGSNAPNGNSAIVFVTEKEALADLITAAKASNVPAVTAITSAIVEAQSVYDSATASSLDYTSAASKLSGIFNLAISIRNGNVLMNSISIGNSPGQYVKDAVDPVVLALEDAQLILDDPTSTTETLLATNIDLISLIAMFKTLLNQPLLSTSSNEYWYYIQGTRLSYTYLTCSAAGATTKFAKNLPLVANDSQLWKLVQNGNGFAIVNKATGEYINADNASGSISLPQASMPVNALRCVPSSEISSGATRFWIQNVVGSTPALLYQTGGSGRAYAIVNNTAATNDNATWLFINEGDVYTSTLLETRRNAHYEYNCAVVGTEFGQFTQDRKDALLAVIEAEDAKDITSMSVDDMKTSISTLTTALAAFKTNSNLSVLAPVTHYKWFRIINAVKPTTLYTSGKALSSKGKTVGQACFLEAKDPNSDYQLFRFVLNDAGTAISAIVNKATGKYLDASLAKLADAPSPTNEFSLNALDATTFSIKPTSAAMYYANADHTMNNWASPVMSPAAWRFEFVKLEPVQDLTSAYVSTRTSCRNKFNTLSAISGPEFGQYSVATIANLQNVIVAEEAKDAATLTYDEQLKGIQDMQAAVSGMSVNTDVKLLQPNTWTKKWFRIINNMAGTGYASGKAMSSNGRLVDEHFTYELKDINSEAQLFRFELTEDQTKVASIINKQNNLYLSANATMALTSTVGNSFEIIQLEGGRSFWIDPTNTVSPDPNDGYNSVAPIHAALAGTNIVNWVAGAGSASAWLFEYVMDETTGIKSVVDFNYTVRIVNKMITVDGVPDFELYTVLGQKQNIHQALTSGVYFVKVNDKVKKVIVK